MMNFISMLKTILLYLKKLIRRYYKAMFFISILLIILSYQINLNPFPNSLVILISFIILLIIPFCLVDIVRARIQVYILLASFCLAAGNWMWVSYLSYYNGVESGLRSEHKILSKYTEFILTSDISETKKKELLYYIFEDSWAEITVTKNNTLFIFVKSKRSTDDYEKEINHSKKFVYKNDVYNFIYSYANRPSLGLGFGRAVTCSFIPDFFREDYSNEDFLSSHLIQRSENFWWPFILLAWALLLTSYHRAQIYEKSIQLNKNKLQIDELNKEILESEKKIHKYKIQISKNDIEINNYAKEIAEIERNKKFFEDQLEENKITLADYKMQIEESQVEINKFKMNMEKIQNNIVEIHQLLHIKMLEDMNAITTSKVKNVLQALLANWSLKHSVDEKVTIEKANENIKKNVENKIHDIKNDITTYNEFYQKNKKELESYIEEILNGLKELPKIVTLELKNYPIKKILDAIYENKNLNGETKRKQTGLTITYTPVSSELINPNYKCLASLEQLKSIVKNLIENSQSAIDQYQDKLDDADEDVDEYYEGKIFCSTNIIEKNGKKYFTITVRDNGGGFSEPDKMYKEAVLSTKKGRVPRKGDGTMFIKYYVSELFNGEIEAHNYTTEDGLTGAETIIYLPIITD